MRHEAGFSVKKRIPRYLRLHTDGSEAARNELQDLHELENCRDRFQEATGWLLEEDRDASPAVKVKPDPQVQRSGATIPEASATALGAAILALSDELNDTRHALWQREAELAAGVPISAREDEDSHLAERLEAIVQGAAEAVGCDAAAAYLLDDATSELKLRSAWNLPKKRFSEDARPLRGAVADLEALLGHAVVLDDVGMLPSWNAPEDYAAAVCVPISTPHTPLGTLWVFSETPRDFSAAETNVIEIVAGRIASELEREMLLEQGVAANRLEQDYATARYWQQNRLPTMEPVLDEWEVAGWTESAGELSGQFHDWCILPDGQLALAVGKGQGAPVEAALNATTLQTALKAHANYRHDAHDMLSRVNQTIWTSSVGDQQGSLAYALVDPESNRMEIARAGSDSSFLIREQAVEVLPMAGGLLGSVPELPSRPLTATLNPGETLVMAAIHGSDDIDEATNQMLSVAIHKAFANASNWNANEAVRILSDVFGEWQTGVGYSVIVLRRATSAADES